MFKKGVAALIATVCIAVPASVSAETVSTEKAKDVQQLDISKLSENQRADLKSQLEKMIQLKKETVQKMVDNGSITKEQGEQMLNKLDEKLKSVQEGNLDSGKHKSNSEHKNNDKSPDKTNSKNKKVN